MLARTSLLAALGASLARAVPAPAPAPAAQVDPLALTDPYSLAAALPTLAAAGEQYISGYAPYAAGYLSRAIDAYAPTAVVSDVPGLLSTAEPLVESYLDYVATAVAGPYIPDDVESQIPGAVASLVPALESEVDALVTQLPATLSLAALPGVIESNLPAIESEIAADVSAGLPILSSYITQYASIITSIEAEVIGGAAATGVLPAPTGGANATAVGSGSTPTVQAPTATASGIAISTGAAGRNEGWAYGVVGAAAGVAALAML